MSSAFISPITINIQLGGGNGYKDKILQVEEESKKKWESGTVKAGVRRLVSQPTMNRNRETRREDYVVNGSTHGGTLLIWTDLSTLHSIIFHLVQ